MKNFRAPLFLSALLALAGCGGGHHHPDSAAGPAPLYCPQVAVLEQAQTLTEFLPGRQDVAARLTTAQITGVSGSCVLERHKNAVLVTVKASFLADNGPANQNADLALPWLAAITQGENIIQTSQYSQKLHFDPSSTTAAADAKPVKIELPNDPDNNNTQILVGFEMTPDEQAYAATHPNAAP